MTREINQLIKKLKTLSPEEVARVEQFLQQLKSPDLRIMQAKFGAVTEQPRQSRPAQIEISQDEAQSAHEACEQWQRRPFQAIAADDLQPIAALFREAVDNRASSRFRFGSR